MFLGRMFLVGEIMTMPHIDFRANTQRVPPNIPAATQKNARTALVHREQVVGPLGDAYWQSLRQAAHDLRLHAITHLDYYLPLLEEKVIQAGGQVHWAGDAADARRIVQEIAAPRKVTRIVKVKSMATEEIELNHALQGVGLHVLESDLGEFIVQLAGVKPSHIIAPALHMTKEEIAAL
ncbi:MAG TPA: LUD domain-containing protein, partial [Anaerolineae bacterium]